MDALTRGSVALGSALALVLLAGVAAVGLTRLAYERDPEAFIEGLDRGSTTNACLDLSGPCGAMRSTFAPADDDFLIAEGDRACDWLDDQPYPWWRRGERFSFDGLVARYRRENPMEDSVWRAQSLRPEMRATVVGSAWHDLCGEAWALREPRNPFNRPPSD